ncbi:hypothetical protein C2869_14525 [Saccharobesus litoralis]|uniref:HTH araC/xylS-type domain-containing protein n=1 Tax=Saccharobesus litoralis TaxID=2172099 RepID=A0A2S0VTP2_9ALTE|nr:helix-turn-helix domain-containing protein [Saccharobesus litoralis]AWB67581.1 hypothetical protein C2869_14525 [Saccharobesus litoralis]
MKNRELIAQKIRGKQIVSYRLEQFIEQAPDLIQCVERQPKFESPFSADKIDRYLHSQDRSLKLVPGAAVFLCHEELPAFINEKYGNEDFYSIQYVHQCNAYNLSHKNRNLRSKLSVSAIGKGATELISYDKGTVKTFFIIMSRQGLENLCQLSNFDSKKLFELQREIDQEKYAFHQLETPLTFRTKFEDLMKLVASKESSNVLAVSANIFSLVSDIIEIIDNQGINEGNNALSRQHNLAQNAKNFIDDYTNMVTNAQQLAEMLNTSVSTLQRQFKLAYNESIGQYIKDKRLESAAEFLDQDMSIEEVSELLGYSYRSAFERAFKNHYGYSPGNHVKRK